MTNSSQDFECFEPGPELREQVFRLWCAVFDSWTGETRKIIADRLNAGFRAGTVRTPALRLRSTGELAGALRLECLSFAGKNAGEVKKGVHVGEVAVLPAFQGCGAGTLLMNYTVTLLKKTLPLPDFAFLGGYTGFYRRFGFVPVDGAPRIELPLSPERGGTKRFPVSDRLGAPVPGAVRRFLPETDGEAVMRLQSPAPGERVIDADMLRSEFIFRNCCAELDCIVTPGKGPVRGFLFRCGTGIYNAGFADGEARETLLSEALRRIAATGALTASISGAQSACEQWLREKKLPFRRISPVGGICSAMRLELKR